ncbi:site-specific integrase, partial [Bacillus cereus]|nr:site-specific integrase [Bacillus cereus]
MVRFLSIDDGYKKALKYYTLIKNNSVLSIQRKVYMFGIFLVFLKANYQGKTLKEVDRSIINKFEYELRLNHEYSTNRKSYIYSAVQDIFEVMRGFPVFPDIVPTKEINPFKQVGNKNKRVIPNEVIKKLDFLMKDFSVNVPLEFRTLYWLMRSFPNRITEILS